MTNCEIIQNNIIIEGYVYNNIFLYYNNNDIYNIYEVLEIAMWTNVNLALRIQIRPKFKTKSHTVCNYNIFKKYALCMIYINWLPR